MIPNYVETKQIGSLSYRIEKNGGEYRLWLGGCRIGRPGPNKEVREFHATTLAKARKELMADARERLETMVCETETRLSNLHKALASLNVPTRAKSEQPIK